MNATTYHHAYELNNSIRYGVSVGRRQPMHVVHIDCIREIVQAGLHPVLVIGSANSVENPCYNPLKNPLNEAQQREQIDRALQAHSITEYTTLALADTGETDSWVDAFITLLTNNAITPHQTVMHFRPKQSDYTMAGNAIKSLSTYQDVLKARGLSMWQSRNRNPAYDSISATPMRVKDLFNNSIDRLAAADYITKIAQSARINNPDNALLAQLPITLLDCTLERLHLEKKQSTATLLKYQPATTVDALYQQLATIYSH